MPRYRVIEHHAYTLTFELEAPTALAACALAAASSADEADEEELGRQYTTYQVLPDGPPTTLSEEYIDEDGMAVDLAAYAEEESNPFEHQSGPNGCPVTCPACGWDVLYEDGDDDEG